MDESKKMKSELGNRQWQNLARRWEGNMRDGCRPWRCWLESGVSNQEVLTPSSMWQEVPKVFWAGKSFIQSVGYRSGKMGLKSWGQGATEGDKVAMWSKSEPSAEGQDDNFKESIFYSVVKEKTKKENTGVMRQTEKKAKVYQRIKGWWCRGIAQWHVGRRVWTRDTAQGRHSSSPGH